MESKDDSFLRSRSRAFPKMPSFPDLNSSLDGESSPEKDQQDNGDNHITSNGEKNLISSIAEPSEKPLTFTTVDF